MFKIGVVAAGSRVPPERVEGIEAWMAEHVSGGDPTLVLHPSLHAKHGHFAGDDATRARALVEFANDPRIDAIWFARGGYGACRIAEAVIPQLGPEARRKRYLGYSDAGSLLAAMYKAGFEHLAHGPMADDVRRGVETGRRALAWLTGAIRPGSSRRWRPTRARRRPSTSPSSASCWARRWSRT